MSIWKDEVVAPALSVALADTLEEAIELATRSDFANGACVYTDSAKPIRQFRDAMDAGMLGGERGCTCTNGLLPFFQVQEVVFRGTSCQRASFFMRERRWSWPDTDISAREAIICLN